MPDTLQELIDEMIPGVEQEMRDVLKFQPESRSPFYGMIHYHMGWADQSFRPVSEAGGKRVRPLLCLLTTRAAGGRWESSIPGAAALELLHNFTLIHDDIQDSSPRRRGRLTLWNIWGANQAINSGDAVFAMAHLAMIRMLQHGVPAQVVVEALRRMDETCISLTRGQYADMNFEQQPRVTIDEYLSMISGKTAALLSFSSELGALAAESSTEQVEHYAAFGRELGLAFQMRDDILGIWGDESVIGKSSATDIATRKKSLPVLYGLANSEELRLLYENSASDDQFVTRVVALLDAVEARDYAESLEREYTASALSNLEAAEPVGRAAVALGQLTDVLLKRRA